MATTPPLIKNPKCLKDLNLAVIDFSIWRGHPFSFFIFLL